MSNLRRFTRRSALKSAGAAAAAAGLPNWFLTEVLDAAPVELTPAGDKPNVALVGCGGRGQADAKASAKFCTLVAFCDVDDRHAQAASVELSGGRAKTYRDFRQVLERKDVHAIINGTPDHWHTLINLAAMKAGKDVYSEKPLTLTIDEGVRVVQAVKDTGRVLQTGSQQRSEANFRLACELIRNGRIGKLQEITVILPAGLHGGPFPEKPVPEGLDWDAWLGQAPKVAYAPERCHATFRYFYDYSGGTVTDWGAHHNDIALWAMGLDHSGPVTVQAEALAEPVPGGYTAFSEYHIEYTYANGVRHRCVSTTATGPFGQTFRKGPGTVPTGIRFDGSDGWLWVTRGQIEASKPEVLNDPLGGGAERLAVSGDHHGNFFECVRTRKQPVAPAEAGHRAASVCHLGVIALRLGRKLQWDPGAQRFVNDAEADKHIAREQRKPWTYDAV